MTQLKNPIRWASSFGWACVGTFVTFVTFLIAWLVTYDTLTAELRDRYEWVLPILIVTLVFLAALIALCFVMYWKVERRIANGADIVLGEMNEIHPLTGQTDAG